MAEFRKRKFYAAAVLLSFLLTALPFTLIGCKKRQPAPLVPAAPSSSTPSPESFAITTPLPSAPEAAASIYKTYEQNMRLLTPVKQGHWTLRIFRTSGELRFYPILRTYVRLLQEQFRLHIAKMNNPVYVEAENSRRLEIPPDVSPKKLYRLRALKKWENMAFAKRLLFLAFQIKSFGFHQGSSAADFIKAVNYFRTLPFKDYVLDPQVILYDAAHTTNTVFYLKFLGLGDMEETYIQQFRKVFSTPDEALTAIEFSNKIYGMTHIIIGASFFYQRPVAVDQYAWILDYFLNNIDMIKKRVSPDALAEIAVCFKIARLKNEPLFQAVHQGILEHFSHTAGVVTSSKYPSAAAPINPGDVTALTAFLNGLEHRNIMSYLALTDFENFYPGPNLAVQT